MSEIALARINSFAPEQADVPPEELIFVLSSSQLQEIIIRAAQEATEPLILKVEALEGRIIKQDEKIAALEATQDTQGDNQLIQLRLINELRTADHKDPGKTKITRVEKIAKYLEARPDHKASFETLKGHLGVAKNRLNEAISLLLETYPGQYGISTESRDKRKRILVLFPKLI